MPETFPSHSHLGLEGTAVECEEDSISLWHRQTVNMCERTETAPSDCMPGAVDVSHRQAEPALPSHMDDWEGQLQQEVYHRQILLQQQLLLQRRRQPKQQQQQQQQQQQSNFTGELLMPLHSYAWRLGSCKDESMMGDHLDFLQDYHQPEIVHRLGAAVQLSTGVHPDFRSASDSAGKTGESITPEMDTMVSTG